MKIIFFISDKLQKDCTNGHLDYHIQMDKRKYRPDKTIDERNIVWMISQRCASYEYRIAIPICIRTVFFGVLAWVSLGFTRFSPRRRCRNRKYERFIKDNIRGHSILTRREPKSKIVFGRGPLAVCAHTHFNNFMIYINIYVYVCVYRKSDYKSENVFRRRPGNLINTHGVCRRRGVRKCRVAAAAVAARTVPRELRHEPPLPPDGQFGQFGS